MLPSTKLKLVELTLDMPCMRDFATAFYGLNNCTQSIDTLPAAAAAQQQSDIVTFVAYVLL